MRPEGRKKFKAYDGLNNIARVDVISNLTFRKFESVVEIEVEKGNIYHGHIIEPKGSPKNPMSLEEVVKKFKILASSVLISKQVIEILQRFSKLEHLDNIVEVCRLLGTR